VLDVVDVEVREASAEKEAESVGLDARADQESVGEADVDTDTLSESFPLAEADARALLETEGEPLTRVDTESVRVASRERAADGESLTLPLSVALDESMAELVVDAETVLSSEGRGDAELDVLAPRTVALIDGLALFEDVVERVMAPVLERTAVTVMLRVLGPLCDALAEKLELPEDDGHVDMDADAEGDLVSRIDGETDAVDNVVAEAVRDADTVPQLLAHALAAPVALATRVAALVGETDTAAVPVAVGMGSVVTLGVTVDVVLEERLPVAQPVCERDGSADADANADDVILPGADRVSDDAALPELLWEGEPEGGADALWEKVAVEDADGVLRVLPVVERDLTLLPEGESCAVGVRVAIADVVPRPLCVSLAGGLSLADPLSVGPSTV
jgi:hypothetical protein